MNRTQISLTPDQHTFLEQLSRRTGESISALIRKMVDRLRREEEMPSRKALRLVGAFAADEDDISIRHDSYLGMEPPAPAAPPRKKRRG